MPGREHDEDEQGEGGEGQQVSPTELWHDKPGQQGLEASARCPEKGERQDGVATDGRGKELRVDGRYLDIKTKRSFFPLKKLKIKIKKAVYLRHASDEEAHEEAEEQ